MEMPKACKQALQAKRDVVLACDAQGFPHVEDEQGSLLWDLPDFTYGAASLFLDNLLEGRGYRLVASSGLRWRYSDALEKVG